MWRCTYHTKDAFIGGELKQEGQAATLLSLGWEWEATQMFPTLPMSVRHYESAMSVELGATNSLSEEVNSEIQNPWIVKIDYIFIL